MYRREKLKSTSMMYWVVSVGTLISKVRYELCCLIWRGKVWVQVFHLLCVLALACVLVSFCLSYEISGFLFWWNIMKFKFHVGKFSIDSLDQNWRWHENVWNIFEKMNQCYGSLRALAFTTEASFSAAHPPSS